MARGKTLERGAKSAAIRQYVESHPLAPASEIIAALATTGIKVSGPTVYQALRKAGSNGHASNGNGRAETKPADESTVQQLDLVSVSDLFAVKELILACGNVKAAEQAFLAFVKLCTCV